MAYVVSMGHNDTSIRVSQKLADELWNRKERGDSYEDVIWRLIEQADTRAHAADTTFDERGDPSPNNTEPPREDSNGDVLDDVLDGWPQPPAQKRDDRHRAGRQVLEWLRDRGDPVTRSDIVDELSGDASVDGQSEDTWWRKTARPAIAKARDADLVTYHNGRKTYHWVGSSAN